MNWFTNFLPNTGAVSLPDGSDKQGDLEALLRSLERSSKALYICPGGYNTIGVGHLVIKNDASLIKVAGSDDVRWLRSNPLTDAQVKTLLSLDVDKFRGFVRGFKWKLTQCQEDALVSFIFNIGTGAFNRSTMKRYLEARSQPGVIADEFPRWRLGGRNPRVILPGLQKRRAVEASIFLGRDTISDHFSQTMPTKYHRGAQQWLDAYWKS